MSYLIRCYTLFDITATGARQRSCPVDIEPRDWNQKRNQQCNFDTVVQSISIRSLPEILSNPRLGLDKPAYFGTQYRRPRYWQFDFSVSDVTVWQQNHNSLYYLYQDCEGIPMIICGTEVKNLPGILLIGEQNRNIYFEVLGNEARY